MLRLINWEALNELSQMANNSIELLLIDPPYWTTACEWDKYINFKEFFELAWQKITKNGSIIVFASWSFTPRVMLASIEEYKYKYTWIKNNSTNFVHSKNRPMTKHEDILVFSKAPMGHISQIWEDRRMIYNPQGLIEINKTIKAWKWRFWTIAWIRPSHKEEFERKYTNFPTDVISDIPEPSSWSKLHTSEKPIKLLEKLILTHSNNWLIVDSFMGSWSCWEACKNLNRDFIWIEKEEKYFKVSFERLSKWIPIANCIWNTIIL